MGVRINERVLFKDIHIDNPVFRTPKIFRKMVKLFNGVFESNLRVLRTFVMYIMDKKGR